MAIRQLLYAMDFGFFLLDMPATSAGKKTEALTDPKSLVFTTVTGNFETKVFLLFSNQGKEKGEN